MQLSHSKENGHYLYTVVNGSVEFDRRFTEFRALRATLRSLLLSSFVEKSPFPPDHLKNKIGIKLSIIEAAARATQLESWIVEMNSRKISEKWPDQASLTLGNFLNGSLRYERSMSLY